MEERDERPDWNIAKINIRANPGGLIVTLCLLGVMLLGLPPLRWFLIVSVPLGLIAALILHFTARDR